MNIDIELYRKEITISYKPELHISLIDIVPELPQKTYLFIHGFSGSATQWKYQLNLFSSNNRVIAPDLRGHGHSGKPIGKYTTRELVNDLVSVLDNLGVVDKIILLGHSFGGAIASEFVLTYPKKVERLILIATSGEYRLNWLYRTILSLPISVINLLAPLFHKRLGAPPFVLKAWYENSVSVWRGWDDVFPKLDLPVLVIRGHHDRVFEQPFYQKVTQAIPNAIEEDVGASGHMVMLERHAAVNRAIERFVDKRVQTWRDNTLLADTPDKSNLSRLRPWLPLYDPGVPYTIANPNLILPQLLHSAARRYPFHTAIIYEGKKISYRQLEQSVMKFANSLLSLGLEKGDRVLIFLPNIPQFIITFYGTLLAGGVVVFSLPITNQDDLIHQIHDSGSRFIITLRQSLDITRKAMRKARSELDTSDLHSEAGIHPSQHIIYTDAEAYLPWHKSFLTTFSSKKDKPQPHESSIAIDEHDFTKILKTPAKKINGPISSADDLAVIIYTGGTTADPKGVMLSHRNLVANALQTRYWFPDMLDGKERFLCVIPFVHSYGLTTTINAPILCGAALIVKPKFDIADVLATIKRYRPTIFPGIPRIYISINDYPGVRKYNISSIKACICGADPLPIEVQEAFEKLTHGKLVEGYGLTEASPVTHANPIQNNKVGSIGIPLPSTEAKIVDLKNGLKDVQVGQIGELVIRGPQVMLGYWQNSYATRRVLTKDGWLYTGDIALIDKDGYYHIIARKADMWYPHKPGKPAFPRDVEEVIYEIPQVKEVAVVAIAGQPIAYIMPKTERPSPESIIAYCKRRLPPELVPKLVIFVDNFPRTFIGKIIRRELVKHIQENQ